MRLNYTRVCFYALALLLGVLPAVAQETLLLNGEWQMGEGRNYQKTVDVPGIHCNPTEMNADTLWYRREVVLPKGNWKYATLELKGARFAPAVYVDGELASRTDGGMAPTFHLLKGKGVKPGRRITLEVALSSLKTLSPLDASYIAVSDHWRSNISSSLWDDVQLHVHGTDHVVDVIPDADVSNKELGLTFFVDNVDGNHAEGQYKIEISDRQRGNLILTSEGAYHSGKNSIRLSYKGKLTEWTPEHPQLYQLTVTLKKNRKICDQTVRKLGLKQLEVRDKQFFLNGHPYKLRGGSITWHRWMRTEEGAKYGYDADWFRREIIGRMKERGANEINFHLGLAPTRLLNLCDEEGVLVRYEWSFFHGISATESSCKEQYARWLSSSMEHPCAAYYYPYNETSGKDVQKAWNALNDVLADYPPLVLAHRDVLHLHKYWWSIFENLGVYYDSYKQFEKAVMADEFGGNYLNREGDYGGYPAVEESFLRFCGRDNTREQRFRQQCLSTGKIAEYWRRTDVAGWTPYTIISSHEDGNNWFLGSLGDGNPMPVWDSMTAAWSPMAVSLDIWDVNYASGQTLSIPLHFFNDLSTDRELMAEVSVVGKNQEVYASFTHRKQSPAFSHLIDTISVTLPNIAGEYTLRAELLSPPDNIARPVVSEWTVRVFQPTMPTAVGNCRIFLPEEEQELRDLFMSLNLTSVDRLDDANLVVLSSPTWKRISAGDKSVGNQIEEAIGKGISVVMLDVGPQTLGKGYPIEGQSLKSLLNPPSVSNPRLLSYPLFGSIILNFKESAEAETNILPDRSNNSLWSRLPDGYRGMWNGLRGCLAVPAWELEVQGVNADLFLEQWAARGADVQSVKSGRPYYAYELHGYYEYSDKADDYMAKQRLHDQVMQKIEDAPSLAVFINPDIPIKTTDLASGYRNANAGMAERMVRMVNAGKNLTKVPVIGIMFGSGKGNLIVSQLLTAGRLSPHNTMGKAFARRFDGTAVQMVLNMMEQALESGSKP